MDKREYGKGQSCAICKNIHKCSGPDWLTGECEPGFETTITVDKNNGKMKDKSYDCTDCKHFSNCYLRRKRSRENNPTHLEICKDFEIDEWMV